MDLLYIHPKVRCSLDYVLPMGAVGLMNACQGTKLGRFEEEVTDEEIAAARVILMDCHWFPSMWSIHHKLVPRIRRVNPRVPIVVGGYTAHIFADQLLREAGVDYVVKGDAEEPLPELVRCLLEGRAVDGVPNIVRRDGATPMSFILTSEVYGRQDYLNIDWHPTMSRYADQLCRSGIPSQTYPWLPVFKGCLLNCDFCYGNPEKQTLLTGRKAVLRPAEAIHRDLRHYSRHPNRYWVHVIADFITMMPRDYVEAVLSEHYDLGVYYEFYNPPKPWQLELLSRSFNEAVITLSMVANHADVPGRQVFVARNKLESTLDEVAKFPNLKVIIQYDGTVIQRVPDLWDRISAMHREHRVYLNAFDNWYMEVPDPKCPMSKRDAEYRRFLNIAEQWRFTKFRFVNWHAVRHYGPWMKAIYWGKTREYLLRLKLADVQREAGAKLARRSPASPSAPPTGDPG